MDSLQEVHKMNENGKFLLFIHLDVSSQSIKILMNFHTREDLSGKFHFTQDLRFSLW